MITALLLAALAQTAAPEIRVDEKGFVTVIETPEARARERQHIKMIADAEQAYTEYRERARRERSGHDNNGTGDLGLTALIEMHERILESGMELHPQVHQRITLRLAELHQSYTIMSTPEARELMRRIEQQGHRGALSQEDSEALHELMQRDKHRQHARNAVRFKEEAIARLPEEEKMEAARLLYETAMMAQTPREQTLYYLRARQKAREAIADDDPHKAEAEGIAETALLNAIGILRQQAAPDILRAIEDRFSDDNELMEQIRQLTTPGVGRQ